MQLGDAAENASLSNVRGVHKGVRPPLHMEFEVHRGGEYMQILRVLWVIVVVHGVMHNIPDSAVVRGRGRNFS